MPRVAIIGAGASGCFAAIQLKSLVQNALDVHILEKSKSPLAKVKISGGGRCNVTHHQFDPEILSTKYPRGEKELRWAFETFQPKDTVHWFKERGVSLKTEEDGRMFPTTDSSETIIQCFLNEIEKHKIKLRLDTPIHYIFCDESPNKNKFRLGLGNGIEEDFDFVLIATGSNSKVWSWMESMGHRIVAPVPSLFTLGLVKSELFSLSGLSVAEASIRILPKGKPQIGPLLITHWGFSGPAALRLSAWEAKYFSENAYSASLEVNWLYPLKDLAVEALLLGLKKESGTAKSVNRKPLQLPTRLWAYFLKQAGISEDRSWNTISNAEIRQLVQILCHGVYQMNSKGVFKEEFVTAGGINRKDIDFKTMQSKIKSGLYFAGEVIDVDGITGGFNFQNAWTTATIASTAIARSLDRV